MAIGPLRNLWARRRCRGGTLRNATLTTLILGGIVTSSVPRVSGRLGHEPADPTPNFEVTLASAAPARGDGLLVLPLPSAASSPEGLEVTADASGVIGTPLVLVGTLAAADPRHGAAMLGTSLDMAGLYAVGDEVLPGVQIREVYARRVILERRGVRETLLLKSDQGGQQRLAAYAAPDAAALPAQPVPGQGFRVYAGSASASLAHLGLRSGDIVMAIDGSSVSSDRDQVFKQLSNLTAATVTVYRRGLLQQIEIQPPSEGEPGPR